MSGLLCTAMLMILRSHRTLESATKSRTHNNLGQSYYKNSKSLQPYGFIRIFTDFLPLLRVYGRNVSNTEGETHCLLIDLPLFWLVHVSNQVRGCTRVKPGVLLVAYYSYTPVAYS